MEQTIRILHLEDLSADAELVKRELKKAGLNFELLWVTNKNDYQKALKSWSPNIILSDHLLPTLTSVESFSIAMEAGITVPFILITANVSEEFAVSRIKDGVTDYLLKDRLERLPSAITNALKKHKAESERQRFLDRIIENEKLLRKTEKLARLGSWKRDIATGTVQWSDEMYTMFGYKLNEVVPSLEFALKHVHPDDQGSFIEVVKQQLEKKDNSKMNFRIIDKAGITKWIYCELAMEMGSNGQPQFIQGFNQDITERKKAEETLRKSEANLTSIIENTDASIYSIDASLNYLTFNSILKDGLLNEYGITVKPGDYVLQFYGDNQDAVNWWKNMYVEAFTGKQLQFTHEFHEYGIHRFISFSINPVWQDNQVVALSCYAREITQQKLAELEIIALNESLEKKVKERTAELSTANKELETFSYSVAHDLRAPLRIINGFVGLLLKDHSDNLNDEGKYLVQVVTENTLHMAQLVGNLLELSRVGRVAISPVSCNMHQIVEQAIEFVKASDSNFKAGIKLHQLPEIKCDPQLIKQVWINLVSNAVKYSGKAEHPLIEIGSKAAKDTTVYYVKDNGTGFDMKLASKLFRPFQRLHKRSDYEGTGVGLALAQVIVTKHGGNIWADGATGKGATFYFSLPN